MKDFRDRFRRLGFVGSQVMRGWVLQAALRVAVRHPGHAYRLPMLASARPIEIVQANLRDRDLWLRVQSMARKRP